MITFYKYQGTGNDFIMIDDRDKTFPINDQKLIEKLCDRRFGIGADGLILLQNEKAYDFKMVYFNSDGRLSSMCGNGGRCLARFAEQMEIVKNEAKFLAVDGDHLVKIKADIIELKMNDVSGIELYHDHAVLNTGSPHYVTFYSDLNELDIIPEARNIRYSPEFSEKGINVNFIQGTETNIKVRTYERGVENETYSCGTGVTAAAITSCIFSNLEGQQTINIETPGGKLFVKLERNADTFSNVWLCGPAEFVFEGKVDLKLS